MLSFLLLFVTTMACSILSQDSISFVDRMLEQSYGSKIRTLNVCPRELNASWLLRPPFTTNSGENASEVRGMFHYVFDLALNKCCAILKAGAKTRINFKTQVLNRSQLHDLLLNDIAFILFFPCIAMRTERTKWSCLSSKFSILLESSSSEDLILHVIIHHGSRIGKFGMPLAAVFPSLPWQFCCRL